MKLSRFKVMKDWGGYGHRGFYIILDRFKLATCIRDKRYTKRPFISREQAEGFLLGLNKL